MKPDSPTTAATKLALLIDGDNVSAAYMPIIVREATKHGAIAVRRIYGQFESGKMKSWLRHVDEFDLTPVNVSPLTRGKNATDMKLVIEAMDMLHGRQLDGFCIASSDGDFTPLAARIRANALSCYGFGAKKAPAKYKALFDHFYECDSLLMAAKKAAPEPMTVRALPAPRRKPRQAKAAPPKQVETRAPGKAARAPVPAAAVVEAIARTSGADGWSPVRAVGNALARAIPGFSTKAYGYAKTADLLRSLPGVETRKDGNHTFVRRARP